LQVSVVASGTQQEIEKVDTMEMDDLGPVIRHSPIRIPSPCITYFLHQRLHVDTQSPKVWCITDNDGHIRDTLLIKEHETTQNRPEDIILHIRYLVNSSPCQNYFLNIKNRKIVKMN
jgi:hypothetical protein